VARPYKSTGPTPEQQVFVWNRSVAVGDEVDYTSYPGAPVVRRRTRTEAQVLSGHTAVVWLEDTSGCVCISHCKPVRKAVAS
jgi:hypothetical protein